MRYLDTSSMLALTQTCWTFFVRFNDEAVWRDICLRPPLLDADRKQSRFTFHGSWKRTVLCFQESELHQRRHHLADLEDRKRGHRTAATCQTSRSIVESSGTIADAAVCFNDLLPRIVACLHKDGAMTQQAYEWWSEQLGSRPLAGCLSSREHLGSRVGVDDPARSASEEHERAPSPFRPALTVQSWQEEVIGKPYLPTLAQDYLQLSTGAINYFLHDGTFLRPPLYALRRSAQHKAVRPHTEYTDHNWAGACLLDLVPLPFFCTNDQFLATMAQKSCSLSQAGSQLAGASAFRNSNCLLEPRCLPDEQQGVTGAVDRRYRLCVDAFQREYESPNLPVVLTGCIDDWPARRTWQDIAFFQHFQDAPLKANGRSSDGRRFRMPATDYLAYATATNGEKPMYIFDKKILVNCPALRAGYRIPPHFAEDLFACMDEDDRPDYRWILAGPDGSGTPFHTDPHGTSAWNAVLSGCKRVTLYPPHVIPPGVEEKWIHSEYYASEPYLRWYRERAHALPTGTAVRGSLSSEHRSEAAATVSLGHRWTPPSADLGVASELQPVEALVFPGDLLFIPSGWWHQVLNYGFTTAVTQNVCSRFTFPRVVADMNTYADRQVRRDFQRALRKAGRDELAVQLRVVSSESRHEE